jgi:hypothetical protein
VSGLLPRQKGSLAAYGRIIRSFCLHDDPICQRGSFGSGHVHYEPSVTQAAADFVIGRLAALPLP